jgi:PTH1 family peptidyl-tRNA hydrolase
VYLIVGLGNPGNKYENTRHNIGFKVVDYLASLYGIKLSKLKHKSILGEGIIQSKKVVIAKPQTYMNLSGESVIEIKRWYKINTGNIIIIYDDISLETGRLRIRSKGSAGGHNGMKSIIYHLNTDVFPRIKVGVGQPLNPKYELTDFVLGSFPKDEIEIMANAIKNSTDAVQVILQAGIEHAMNRFNNN